MRAQMPDSGIYDSQFYEAQVDGSLRSARIVAPIVCNLVRPSSVVDLGCGCGTWLAAFKECGVNRILGLDGDYVPRSSLAISPDCFKPVDLGQPLALNEQFDLAVCLEVGEHLPEKSAPTLVGSLVTLAPVVLFSAAIPLQDGTNHINGQWPDYWTGIFGQFGYTTLDAIRPHIWKNRRVESWYRQNIFLFVREDRIGAYPDLAEARGWADDLMLVHRGILREHLWLRRILKRLPGQIFEAATRRFHKRDVKAWP